MKFFSWDTAKNEKLKRERNVSFEDLVFHIARGDLLAVLEHPNKEKHQKQKMFVVRINDYVYLAPFLESEDDVFLKTIIPSRKATRNYLKEVKDA